MSREILSEIDRDGLRANFNRYTRRAFQMLPKLRRPKILDIGCGSGVPTMELARLSNGEIIGIDIEQGALDTLNRKIEEFGLGERVKSMNCSMLNLQYPHETFDIIWSEGAMFTIGFERGLKEWRQFIKPNGFLVVHARIDNIDKVELIPMYGYILVNKFIIPKDVWWNEYYRILEKKVKMLQRKYSNDPEALALLNKEQKEVEEFKDNPQYHGSVFFVMQKTDS